MEVRLSICVENCHSRLGVTVIDASTISRNMTWPVLLRRISVCPVFLVVLSEKMYRSVPLDREYPLNQFYGIN